VDNPGKEVIVVSHVLLAHVLNKILPWDNLAAVEADTGCSEGSIVSILEPKRRRGREHQLRPRE
jgi:hypothetical protein